MTAPYTDLLTAEEKAALKTAALQLVIGAGGLLAAERVCRVQKSQLAAYYDQHDPDCFMPVDVAAALQRAACAPVMAAELARQQGHLVIPVDSEVDPAELRNAASRAAIESAEALAAVVTEASPDVTERESREAAAAFTRLADKAAARRTSSPAAPTVKGGAAPAVRFRLRRPAGGRLPPGHA